MWSLECRDVFKAGFCLFVMGLLDSFGFGKAKKSAPVAAPMARDERILVKGYNSSSIPVEGSESVGSNGGLESKTIELADKSSGSNKQELPSAVRAGYTTNFSAPSSENYDTNAYYVAIINNKAGDPSSLVRFFVLTAPDESLSPEVSLPIKCKLSREQYEDVTEPAPASWTEDPRVMKTLKGMKVNPEEVAKSIRRYSPPFLKDAIKTGRNS